MPRKAAAARGSNGGRKKTTRKRPAAGTSNKETKSRRIDTNKEAKAESPGLETLSERLELHLPKSPSSPGSPLRSSLKKRQSTQTPGTPKQTVTFNPEVDFSDGRSYPKTPSTEMFDSGERDRDMKEDPRRSAAQFRRLPGTGFGDVRDFGVHDSKSRIRQGAAPFYGNIGNKQAWAGERISDGPRRARMGGSQENEKGIELPIQGHSPEESEGPDLFSEQDEVSSDTSARPSEDGETESENGFEDVDPLADLKKDVKELKRELSAFATNFFSFRMYEEAKACFSLSELMLTHPYLTRYVNNVADGSKYGWGKLFIDGAQRSHLAAALVGKVMETHILDHTYFGFDNTLLENAHKIDADMLTGDAFERVKRRTDFVRQHPRTVYMFPDSIDYAEQIAKVAHEHLLIPLLTLMLSQHDSQLDRIDIDFDAARHQSLISLERLMVHAVSINNKIRRANLNRTDRKPIVFVWRSIPKLSDFNPDEQSCKNKDEIDQAEDDGDKLVISMSIFPALYAYQSVKAGIPDEKLEYIKRLTPENSDPIIGDTNAKDTSTRSRRSLSPSPESSFMEASDDRLGQPQKSQDRGVPKDLVPGLLEILVARAHVVLVWSSPPILPRKVQGQINDNVYNIIVPARTRLYRRIRKTTTKILGTLSPSRIRKSYLDKKRPIKNRLLHDSSAQFTHHGTLLNDIDRELRHRIHQREIQYQGNRQKLHLGHPVSSSALSSHNRGRSDRRQGFFPPAVVSILAALPWVARYMGWEQPMRERIGGLVDKTVEFVGETLKS